MRGQDDVVRHERWVMLATLALLQVVTIVTGFYAVDNDLTLSALTKQPPPAETAPPEVPVVTAGPVLAGLAARPGDGPLPSKGTLTRRLTDALGDRALGSRVGAVVIDTSTGERVFAHDPDTGITPASTTKVVTSVAALASLGPDTRLATRVVQGATPGTIVLVGAGAPLLSRPRSTPPRSPAPAASITIGARSTAAHRWHGTTRAPPADVTSPYTGPDTRP